MPIRSATASFLCQIESFDMWRRNWYYSGIVGERTSCPTSTSADPYFNSTGYDRDTTSWSLVNIDEDFVPDVSNKYWYVRKFFYIHKGTYTVTWSVDDDISAHIVPQGANGTQIFGNVADIDGGSAHTTTNHTYTVSTSGLYWFTVRACEGGGADYSKITAMSPIKLEQTGGSSKGGYLQPIATP